MTATAASLVARHVPNDPSGWRAERGRAWLLRHGLPSTREEMWRYTPVEDIIHGLEASTPAPDALELVSPAAVDELAGDHGGLRLVFVIGFIA